MVRKFSGSQVRRGHTALTRGILKDKDVDVVSKGDQFYNANDFPLLRLMEAFTEWLVGIPPRPQTVTYTDVLSFWKTAHSKLTGANKIVIASTPDEVDREYITTLDGGLLHEAFHSLYTVRGRTIDVDRAYKILSENYNPKVAYHTKAKLLHTLWNIYEDSMIERHGIRDFEGAKYSIQRVHELVWQREAFGRSMDIGTYAVHPEKGFRIKAMSLAGHTTCYLRDLIENYLEGAPLTEYNEQARWVVDTLMQDLVERGRKTTDSYETMELALQTLNRLALLAPTQTPDEEEKQGQGDSDNSLAVTLPPESDDNEDDQSKQNSPSTGSEEDGAEDRGSGDESEESLEEDLQSEGDSESGEESEGDSEYRHDDTSDKGDGEEIADMGSESGDDDTSDASGDDGEGVDSRYNSDGGGSTYSEYAEAPDVDFDALQNAKDAEGVGEVGDVINDLWKDQTQGGSMPKWPLVFDPDADVVEKVTGGTVDTYRKVAAQVRADTLYIRPKMVNYLRGVRRVKRKHKQERGRRLSSRGISQVVYKEKPRPFQTRVKTDQVHTAVSIVMDESGSMCYRLDEARYILTTFAVTLSKLNIPFEVTGFTTRTDWLDGAVNYARQAGVDVDSVYERIRQHNFTRCLGARFRVFRTFDEPTHDKNLAKLMQTEAVGATPLSAGVAFAAERLYPRPEERKLLIAITDGQPNGSSGTKYQPEDMYPLLNNMTDSLEDAGIETLFVGYGSSSVCCLKNHLYIRNLKEFSHKLTEYMFDRMKNSF